MPTTRPRHTITESDELSRALDAAAERWPGEPRGRLVLRLVEAGAQALAAEDAAGADAVRETAGVLTGVYGPDYLERLRDDWPA